jgi:hypothetical protein
MYLLPLIPLAITWLVYTTPCAAKVEWGPCDEREFNTTLTLECGVVKVPLDYSDPNSTTFDLEIVKIATLVKPSKGSILHNFGGPGLESRQSLILLGHVLQQ